MSLQDRDLKGDIISQNPKDSTSVEIEGQNRFCGHRFLLKTKLFGDKRCIYCGKWFHWKDTDALTWMRQGNIDPHNADKVLEPLHCGSDHCQEYHHLWQLEMEKRAETDMWGLFRRLKTKGFAK